MPIIEPLQPKNSAQISISWAPGYATQAQTFARRNQLPIIKEMSKYRGLSFHLNAQGWMIVDGADKQNRPFKLRLDPKLMAQGKDPLLKAMGKFQNVLDLTAGWASDALHIAMSGRNVVAIERHDVIFQLLMQAHAELEGNLAKRLNFSHFDASDQAFVDHLSQQMGSKKCFDLVYMDPMFAHKGSNTANPKRPMQLLQQLTYASSPDNDEHLFDNAMRIATGRVVVKRALKAPYITSLEPQGCIKSKLLRYDLYKPSSHNSV